MWGRERAPWIVAIDRDNVTPPIHEDTVGNATAFDAITTAVPLFRNIRVLQKSWDYVRDTSHVNRDLIWTQWLLEIARQIDPQFRRELRQLTDPIKAISLAAYVSLGQIGYTVSGDGPRPRVEYGEGKGNTLFAIFRSLFWEHAKQELTRRKSSQEPEDIPRANRLTALLADPLKVDYLILCCLLPLQRMPTFAHLCRTQSGMLPNPEPGLQTLIHSFGYELANG
jgi:hypothetical protein